MKTTATPRAASRSGMTLIELLVVMAIIMILMGLVIGIAGASQRGAAEAKAKAQIGQIVLELEKFRGDNGRYPNNLTTDFWAWYDLRYPNTVFDMTDLTGTGASRRMIDPWGQEYVYILDSPFIFRLGSRGPDGRFGSAGDPPGDASFGLGDDITSRNLN